MKKIFFTALVGLGMLSSCSGFLDEVDQDKLIPSKTEHYASVLLKCNHHDYPHFSGIDYMSDDLTEYKYSTEGGRKGYKPKYTWQLEIELDENGNKIGGNDLWEKAYKNIAIANYIIELIPEADGEPSERMFVEGEARFIRALNYFHLLNIYGQPYNPATASQELGVPLRLDNGVEQVYMRNTVQECYDQIINDLLDAETRLSESGIKKSKFHPSVGACQLLISRCYLYMQNWEKAAQYAGKAMEHGAMVRIPSAGPVISHESAEILYSGQFSAITLGSDQYESGWRVSPELIRLFDKKNDLRFNRWFSLIRGKIGTVYYCNKGTNDFTTDGRAFTRVVEAYLNRAEAYAHMNKVSEATADMLAYMKTRYAKVDPSVIPSESAQLINFILTERRKEFCFEDSHRWYDLRRMENAPSIKHEFTITDTSGAIMGSEIYTLFPNDKNYTMSIPLNERQNNPLIQNNERYAKMPEFNTDITM